MYVYLLTYSEPGERDETLGVFSTPERAVQSADEWINTKDNYWTSPVTWTRFTPEGSREVWVPGKDTWPTGDWGGFVETDTRGSQLGIVRWHVDELEGEC